MRFSRERRVLVPEQQGPPTMLPLNSRNSDAVRGRRLWIAAHPVAGAFSLSEAERCVHRSVQRRREASHPSWVGHAPYTPGPFFERRRSCTPTWRNGTTAPPEL